MDVPFFRIGDKLHYFAHVPKCAGSSVEAYLRARFGPLAFVDTAYRAIPVHRRWTRSSPQHITVEDLRWLVPSEWIASSFAIVRHPVTRLISAFKFQAEIERTIPESWAVADFVADWVERSEREPYLYDNHLRPQTDLVPPDATVFRLEDGLAPVVDHLDRLAGNKSTPREITPENVRPSAIPPDSPRLRLQAETLTLIGDLYAEDFQRFGYSLDEPPRGTGSAPRSSSVLARIARRLRL